jgi:hypothetical protein
MTNGVVSVEAVRGGARNGAGMGYAAPATNDPYYRGSGVIPADLT